MSVEDRYDQLTQLYAEVNVQALERRPMECAYVDAFAAATSIASGIVLDVGCGPGHVTDHLRRAGVEVIGYDISSNMIAYANDHYPDASFAVGHMGALPHAKGTVGGILSRYSLIHEDPARLAGIFEHWAQILEPGGPATLAFYAADTPERHGAPA